MLMPERIGRYRVEKRIGQGGMGEVYRAWDPDLLRDVAIKRLLTSNELTREALERLVVEARAPSALRHPAIVVIYDVIHEDDDTYLVEEFIEGMPLRQRLGQAFPIDQFLTIVIPSAEALVCLGERGIVHCDLKPENIMLEAWTRPRIVDFGLARSVPPSRDVKRLPAPGSGPDSGLAGTLGYMPPEYLSNGHVDLCADIFSLGVVFYEMLTTNNPFLRHSKAATIDCTLRYDPPPPSRYNKMVSRVLDGLVLSMLAKEPSQRPTAVAVVRLLREVESSLPDPAVRIPPAWDPLGRTISVADQPLRIRRPPPPPRRRPLLLVERSPSSGTPTSSPIGDGLVEAVRSRLARVRGLDILQSQQDATPSLVLSVTVESSGDRLSVRYRLVATESGRVLADALEEGEARHPIDLRDRLCEKVIGLLVDEFGVEAPESAPHSSSTDPSSYDYYSQARTRLGQAHDDAGLTVATELFEKAFQSDPSFAPALAGLAETYAKRYAMTHDLAWADRAQECAHRASVMAPSYPEVRLAVAQAYLTTGKADLARRTYEEILETDPWIYDARLGLGRALDETCKPREAEEAFLEAIKTHPAHSGGHNTLGAFYLKRGRYQEALSCFLRVVDFDSDYAQGWSNVGSAYLCLGRKSEAMESYKRSIGIRPNYYALSNLATLYRSEDRLEEAAESYRNALALDDRDHRVWGNLGATYLYIPGREKDAEDCFRRAIDRAEREREVNPTDPTILGKLAQYYSDLGQKVVAVQHVERALDLDSARADIQLAAAAVYEDCGDRQKATAALKHALKLGASHTEVRGEPALRPLLSDPEIRRLMEEEPSGCT